MNRGEIYLALAPTFDGSTPKTCPFLVVQADFYNQRIKKVLLAPITSNLARKNDPAHLLIEVSTPEGQTSGLRQDSLVSCLNLVVLLQSDVKKKLGVLSDDLMQQIDECLKAALGIP
jgi:mRNA interferase MazF